jgi:molybdate transport system ATP-binding protein
MLSVRLQKRRGTFALDVAFDAPTPGVVALFGRSGCGKSTATDLIAGLLRPDAGRIEVDGELLFESGKVDVPAEKRRIGYVFQEPRLFPHRSVHGNLTYGLARSRGPASIAQGEIIDLLGLRDLLGRRPHQLSGGERQRVAIGRALLSQPRLLLLDEPLASLDRARRQEVLPYLERLRDRFRIPIVYVSHQFDEVLRLATYMVLVDQGRVRAQGEVTQVSRAAALREVVAEAADGAIVDAEIEPGPRAGIAQIRIGAAKLELPCDDPAPRGRVRLQIAARDVMLAAEEPRGLALQSGALPGAIASLEPQSADVLRIEVDVGGAHLVTRVAAERARELGLAGGQRVWLVINAASLRDVLPGDSA